MTRTGRILVLDDESRWREGISSILREVGFSVETAGSTAMAEEKLAGSFYHLAILDISMVPGDKRDDTGLVLLGKLGEVNLLDAMQIIVLSHYGTPEQMRTAFKKHKVADFQSKDVFHEDPAAFVAQVRETFDTKVRVNLDLNIHWEDVENTAEFVPTLRLYGKRLKREPEVARSVEVEFEDLICRLFFTAKSVLLKPLVPGQGGSYVLLATPFYEGGAGQPVVVKFGELEKIETEQKNFRKYVQPYVGGGRSTSIIDVRRTAHLGGIVYSLLGTASSHLDTFSTFYARADIQQIHRALDNLVHETCAPWYANPGHLQLLDLSSEYRHQLGYTRENLESALANGLKSVQGKQQLYFEGLGGRAFSNPLPVTARHFNKSTYKCITHGDLNSDNVLVDAIGGTWLIDFEFTGFGHILRDLAELDTIVRFSLLLPGEATLSERLEVEDVLCSIQRFSDVSKLISAFKTHNSAVAKAYESVVYIRTLAQRLVGQNPKDDIAEYYIALLCYSVNSIRFYSWPSIQRQHALLSASLLADHLRS
jgi:CheY-like chemotaxis protein